MKALNLNHPNKDLKKTILILTDDIASGGMERQIIELLKGLRKQTSIRVALGILDRGGELEEQAIALADVYFSLHRKWKCDFRIIFNIISSCRFVGVDLIHTFGWMSGLAGLLAAKILKIPIVNGAIRNAPCFLSFRQQISRACMLFSDIIVANSYAGIEAYRMTKKRNAIVIYNGIDFRRFNKCLSSSNKATTVCMVANFIPSKDHELLVDAAVKIKKSIFGLKIVFVGFDRGTLYIVRNRVVHRKMEKTVYFVTGCLNPESIIADSSVCILLSNNGEGISNSIIEYMAMEKPVIATNIGGNPEIIKNGVNGYLVTREVDDVVEKTIFLLKHPKFAKEMGKRGRIYVERMFNNDRMIKEYEMLYKSIFSK